MKDSLKIQSSYSKNKEAPIEDSLTIYTNMEQIAYCLPLPLYEYVEDFAKNEVKAKHVFKHKTKADNEIIVQGMMRSDTSVSIEDYFKNRYAESEEQGEIIEKKELLKNNRCFYAKGYMSNLIYDFRFIHVVWLKKDEVVVFSSTFDINDTTLWNSRLNILLKSSSLCN
ncbi:MAG: hypothetical protein SFY56_07505 [Bacteroidota bacterium]|nr:hypothetical protein [Bacteroidota bacterium]